MLASIMKAFTMDREPDLRLGPPHSVDLSGNTLSFAMPGNLSRDMPADDLVTQTDIHRDDFVRGDAWQNLIRRWWDIKSPGFLGKELGVVMMTISVERVPANHRKIVINEDFDPRKRFDFIMMISEHLHQKYKAINDEEAADSSGEPAYFYSSFARIGDNIEVCFWDEVINGQTWMGYGTGGPHDQLSNHYVIPISDKAFVEIAFTYCPNQGIESPRGFLEMGRRLTDPIMGSLKIDYTPDNPYRSIVEDEWHKGSVNDVVQRYQHDLSVNMA